MMTPTHAEIIAAIRADYAVNAELSGIQSMPILWIRESERTARYQRADIDATLRLLARGDGPERDIEIDEATNQKTLTEPMRRAGIQVGGRLATLIRIVG